jgi:hypothetical protein
MLSSLLKGIVNYKKSRKVDLSILPSRGLFYPDDLTIKVTKATEDDIAYYKANYVSDALGIVQLVKKVVKNNTIMNKGYDFFDISSIDIMYIFFEIVKYTNNEGILIYYPKGSIMFNTHNFNYFELTDEIMSHYNEKDKCFDIKGFKYKIPCIGIEQSTTKFIMDSEEKGDLDDVKDKGYDFMYFMGDKKHLSYEEIYNILTIFNEDLDDDDKKSIDEIMVMFKGMNKYELVTPDENIVEINYPVESYPQKITSLGFDKNPEIQGELQGIKGQYLIFDTGVVNIRKHQGYWLKLESEE